MLPPLPVSPSLHRPTPLGPGRWRATWVPDGAPVVVKVWRVPRGVDAEARRVAQETAAAVLGADTPHVYWRARVDDTIVSVVRWEDGAPPEVPLRGDDPRLVGFLGALGRLHAAGLVHRDLCPRNLLATPAGGLLILDLEEVVPAGEESDVVGTPGSIAPEVARGGGATPAADVFAVGQLLGGLPQARTLATAAPLAWRAASVDELLCLLPLPATAPVVEGEVRGPVALHDVPARAAQLLRLPTGPAELARLCATGTGRATPDGGRQLTPTELHRWEARLLDAAPVETHRARVRAGQPGLVVWSLLEAGPPSSPPSAAWLDTLAVAALETHDPAVLRRVRAVLVHTEGEAAAWWREVLEGALSVAVGAARSVLARLTDLPVPDRLWAWRGHAVVLQRAGARVGVAEGAAVAATLRERSRADDDDAEARQAAWSGVLAMRAGHYERAVAHLEAAWPHRGFAHESVLTATNLMMVHLHLDAPRAAEAVARRAQSRLAAGAHPFAAARLAAKLREAVYRGHESPPPDLALLDAIVVASPPFAVALAVLNEAAAAWRSGDAGLGGQLAADAAVRFRAVGLEGGRLLAGALAHRCAHPAWIRAADRLEAAVDGVLVEGGAPYLPAVAAQVLGLLADGPDDPRAEDARELAAEAGRPLTARREVLSLEEAGRGGRIR